MDREMTTSMMKSVLSLMQMIDVDELDELILQGRRFDEFGAIFQPTMWIHESRKNNLDTRIISAVRDFKAELMQIENDVKEGAYE